MKQNKKTVSFLIFFIALAFSSVNEAGGQIWFPVRQSAIVTKKPHPQNSPPSLDSNNLQDAIRERETWIDALMKKVGKSSGSINSAQNTISVQTEDRKAVETVVTNLTGLITLITAAASNTATHYSVLVNGVINVSDSIAIPPNVSLRFVNNGHLEDGGGTITFAGQGIEAMDYQHIFRNFEAGEILFTNDAPAEISPVWFGAKRMTSFTPPYTSNIDTLGAVNLIAASFQKTGQSGNKQGTQIKIPCGDFYFSDTWTISKAFSVVGCESNAFWSHGTRLYFPKGKNGIVLKRSSYLGESGSDENPNGNILRNLEIRADFTHYTDSTVNITGLTMSRISGSDFGAPLNDGDTVTLESGMNVVVTKRRRTAVFTISSGSTTITSAGANFTSADVGADISFPVSNIVVKIASVTNSTTAVLTANARASLPAVSGYLTEAKVLDIRKPEFVMNLSPGTAADVSNGYQWVAPVASNINRSSTYMVGQDVVFYHGNAVQTTHQILEVNGNSLRISNPLTSVNVPGTGVYTLGIVQSLNNRANVSVRLNKYAGIDSADGALALIDRVRVAYFAGDGIRADTDLRQGNGGTNSNMLRISNSTLELNASNGYHGSGADSNAILLDNLNAINNGGYGVYDDSYLGITMNAGHITDNVSGSIYTKHDSTNQSTFTGVYLEGAAPPMNLGANNIHIGGVNGVGFHPQSQHAVGFGTGDLSAGSVLSGRGLVTRNTTGTMSVRFSGTENSNYFLRGGGRNPDGYRYVTEWGIGYGNVSDYIYFTNLGEELAGFTFGVNVFDHHVLARKLRIGDTTSNTSNYTEMQSGISAPLSGSYPQGYIVWNRSYTSGSAVGWINKTAGAADFEAFPSESSDHPNRADFQAGKNTVLKSNSLTINKPAFEIIMPASASYVTVTNSLVTVNSVVICTLNSFDNNLKSVSVRKSAGSLTVDGNTKPENNTKIGCLIIN